MKLLPVAPRQRGFTLLEILVVVFIIGVILSFATLSLGGRGLDDRANEEARRLAELFRLARDEAGVTGLELGWRAAGEDYQFLALADGGWAAYPARGPLRDRSLPEPLRMTVLVEDLPVAEDEADNAPQILFLSSGEVTPFTVQIGARELDSVYEIRGNLIGQIDMQRVDEDELAYR